MLGTCARVPNYSLGNTLRMSHSGIGGKLTAWRKSKRYDQTELAAALGVHRNTIIGYENEKVSIPAHRMDALVKLGFNPNQDYRSKPESPIEAVANIVTYQMMGMRYAGVLPAGGEWEDPFTSEEFEDVEAKYWKANRWCCRIAGECCWPALWPGDFCIFEKTNLAQYGKIVAAENQDHKATIKKLEAGPDGAAHLLPINPAFEEATAIEWSAIAVLVYVTWKDDDGGEMSFYRTEGIKPSQLTRYRQFNT